MSPGVDDDLRRLFAESADTIEGLPPGFDTGVLDAGAKRRRSRRTMLGATAGALALVAIAAVWQGPSLVNRSTPPTSNNDIPTTQTTDAWVASLSRGDDVEAAYASGQTLHLGNTTVPITGSNITRRTEIQLQGKVSTGWLAHVRNPPPKQSDQPFEIGVVAPDGTFTGFAEPPNGTGQSLVSPDGSMFATGREVRDATTGSILHTIPQGKTALLWVDPGLVIYDPEQPYDLKASLWNPSDPGIPPVLIELPDSEPETAGGALTPSGLVAVNREDCTELSEYDVEMQVPHVRYCAGQTFALSDSGSVALVVPWTALDIDSGDKTRLPVPNLIGEFADSDPQEQSTFFWEDDNNVVFDLLVANNSETVYVRCIISSQHCERASDQLGDATRFTRLMPVE